MSKWQQEAVKNASRTVGSYSDSEFDIRFNPDIFSPDVKHDTTEDEIQNQKQMIKNAAKYLITHQIPTLVISITTIYSCSIFLVDIRCLIHWVRFSFKH